jgi:thioredoxin reductase (NADPH)
MPERTEVPEYDVVVIGGSFAGLSAALQLGRARRDVLVIDAGENRNRFAHAANGLLGHDGKSPADILDAARKDLGKYPTVALKSAYAHTAMRSDRGFIVESSDGSVAKARRLILAIGVSDTLPDIPGLREHWGSSVFHCPYCHGFEVAGRTFGVIANSEMAIHQVALLQDWSDDITLFTNGFHFETGPDPTFRIETGPIALVGGENGAIDHVQMEDGTEILVDAIFTQPTTAPVGTIAQQLGCELVDSVMGQHILLTGVQETSVPGVFAAGDATKMASNLAGAVADGAMAGVAAHRSLVFEPALV